MPHLIITDHGEIEMPPWMVVLWYNNKDKLPPIWRDLPDRETDDGLRISMTEAYFLVKAA